MPRIPVLFTLFLLGPGLLAQTNPVYRFNTNLGNVDVTLYQYSTPTGSTPPIQTVTNFLNYVNAGSFTNSIVHRLVNGFVAQGGEYQLSGSNLVAIPVNPAIPNEFTGVTNATGTIAMALVSGNANSATSQWFFNLANNGSNGQNLDSQMFTVFGATNAAGITVLNKINGLTTADFSATTGFSDLTNVPLTGSSFVVVNSILPVPTITGIASAASFVSSGTNGISPGEIIAIFGSGLGPSTGLSATPVNGVFGTSLGGTQVTFNGAAAPIYYTSSGQVNVVVPYSVGNLPVASVNVSYNGLLPVAAMNFNVKPANPAIFTQYPGTDGVIVRYPKYDVIGKTNPASPGDLLILYGEGYGAATPTLPDGTIVTTTVPAPTASPLSVIVDGQTLSSSNVKYFGAAGGEIQGVLQVNFVVPQIAAGSHQIQLVVGSRMSPSGVTLQTK